VLLLDGKQVRRRTLVGRAATALWFLADPAARDHGPRVSRHRRVVLGGGRKAAGPRPSSGIWGPVPNIIWGSICKKIFGIILLIKIERMIIFLISSYTF
jgi:hypothetical protein